MHTRALRCRRGQLLLRAERVCSISYQFELDPFVLLDLSSKQCALLLGQGLESVDLDAEQLVLATSGEDE